MRISSKRALRRMFAVLALVGLAAVLAACGSGGGSGGGSNNQTNSGSGY